MDVDVAVVGAGPSGAATASLLAARGWRVALLDRACFPRDKICGEALAPGALPLLDGLGVRAAVEAAGARVGGVRIHSAAGAVCEGRYPVLDGLPAAGVSLSRRRLDALLVDAAVRRGVGFEDGVSVRELLWDGDRCTGLRTDAGRIGARAVVLAEGRVGRLHPAMRRPAVPSRRRRMAYLATFAGVEGLTDLMELHLRRPDLQVVVGPQGADVAVMCVVLTGGPAAPLGAPPLDGLLSLLCEEPSLAARLTRARPLTPLKGMALDPYAGDPAPAQGLVAVGDALCHFDPLTGEGMFRALRSGLLAANALDEALGTAAVPARLQGFACQITREFRWTYRFVDAVVALSRWELGGHLAVRELARRPAIAARMVGYQGALLPADRFFPDLLRLAVPL